MTRDFIGYGPTPPDPSWPNGARLAVNFVLNHEEGSEPSYPDGDNVSEWGLTEAAPINPGVTGRDLAAESMFAYGSRVGVWRILRLFAERNLPLTVFGCALALERNPAVAAAIRAAGHDVCCHGWRWIKHYDLTESEERAQIAKAVASITATMGERPAGWYCRYGPSLNTRRLLIEEGGFLYDSDAYDDELPYWTHAHARPHLIVPYTLSTNDVKFGRGSFGTAEDFFTYCRDAFDMLYAEGRTQPKMLSIGLHNRIIGHPARAVGLQRLLDHVSRHAGVWITRRIDIAHHWASTHPAASA
jgi:allantoinase